MRRQQCRPARRQVEPQPDGFGQLDRADPRAAAAARWYTSRRWILAVTLPVFSYTGTIRPGMDRFAVLVVEDLVLRVGQLQTAVTAHLDSAEQARPAARATNTSRRNGWFSHVARIEPLGSVTSASKILKPGRRVDRRPQLETRPDDRGDLAGPQRRNRLKAAAIFVADRKPVQQIFDGEKADAFEIGGAGADALEELQGRRRFTVDRSLPGHREAARRVHCYDPLWLTASLSGRPLIAPLRPGRSPPESRGSVPAARTGRRCRCRRDSPACASSSRRSPAERTFGIGTGPSAADSSSNRPTPLLALSMPGRRHREAARHVVHRIEQASRASASGPHRDRRRRGRTRGRGRRW